MKDKENLIVITGPTASGKSTLAHKLAKKIGGAIINADSVQVYQGFDIGSAKPSTELLEEVPYRLISTVSPTEDFDAWRFCEMAKKEIQWCKENNKIGILCGGTGLYIRSLLCGLLTVGEITEKAKASLEELEQTAASTGEESVTNFLYQKLLELDPDTASELHPNDRTRIERALLVYFSGGPSLKHLRSEHEHSERPYRALVIALLPEREGLYQKINERVDEMLDAGLVDEVKTLLTTYSGEERAFRSIGYRHVRSYLKAELTYERMVEELKRDTRRFAKRQFTWWRNQPKRLSWKQLFPDQVVSDLRPNQDLETSPNCATSDCLAILKNPRDVEDLQSLVKDFLTRRSIFYTEEALDEEIYYATIEKMDCS